MNHYFNYFLLDIQLEILKYNPSFRRVNKTFHTEGFYLFKKQYSNTPISIHEVIKNKSDFCIFIWDHHNFIMKRISVGENLYRNSHHYPKFEPNGIDPNYYTNNLTLFHRNTLHNTLNDLISDINSYKKYTIFYDLKTTLNVLNQRNLGVFNKSDVLERDMFTEDINCSDFDRMFIKVCNLIYLASPDNLHTLNIFNRKLPFRLGKCVNQYEYNTYLKELDQRINLLK